MLPASSLLPLLLAVPIVILACQAGGWLARRLGQPPVIGEIVVGIVLGPSVLGLLAPELQRQLLPASLLPVTSALGNLALLTFLFLIGLELDLGSLRGARRALVSVSVGSVLVPMFLGALLGTVLYPRFAPPGVGRVPFVMFVAVAVSITAFPVLARILDDRNLNGTFLGSFVMAAAAVNDVIAWCLLTIVIALVTAGSPLAVSGVVVSVALLGGCLYFLRPVVTRVLQRLGRTSDELVLVALCVGLWLTAYVTDRIGVHPAFGAFLFGAVAPRSIPSVERSAARIRAVFVPVLLPFFFVDIGLHTDLSGLTWDQWGWAAAVLGVAVVGKWSGAAGAARLTGSDWRWAAAVGVLMNCRGLTELVVLGIGRQIGVISPELFSVLVVMAVLTTLATGPLLDRILSNETEDPRFVPPRRDPTPTQPADRLRGGGAAAVTHPGTVLEAVLTRRSARQLVDPAPDAAELLMLVEAAATAPDHGLIRPWRLIILDGDDRARLGEALHAATTDPEQAQRAAAKPLRAPLLVSIVFRPNKAHPKVPEWEQLAAAAAMTQTLLLLLHSRGWGAIWRTGAAVDAEPVRRHLRLDDDERLLGWLYIGTCREGAPARPRPPIDVRERLTRLRDVAPL